MLRLQDKKKSYGLKDECWCSSNALDFWWEVSSSNLCRKSGCLKSKVGYKYSPPKPIQLIIHSPITLTSSYVVSDVARFIECTSIQSIMSIRSEWRIGLFIYSQTYWLHLRSLAQFFFVVHFHAYKHAEVFTLWWHMYIQRWTKCVLRVVHHLRISSKTVFSIWMEASRCAFNVI